MKNVTIQVQSVIYHNDKKNLEKAISGLANAVRNDRNKNGYVKECIIKYGDASKEPIYTEEEIQDINNRYGEYLRFEYVYFNCNTGTSKGHNWLFEGCETDYLMIMNPDVIVCPQYFEKMLEPFEKRPDIGLVEARQTPIEHPKEYDIHTMATAWSSGACNIVPAKLFREVGGYDADTFFMYCDDVDISWRIRLAGYNLYYQPLAPVYHAKQLGADASWQPTDAERYYSAEAALFMAHKWSNPKLVARYLWDFKRCGDANMEKAANEYLRRKKEGTLPKSLDKEHKVAKFVEGSGYAQHRFVM